jgi:hypothetical protein
MLAYKPFNLGAAVEFFSLRLRSRLLRTNAKNFRNMMTTSEKQEEKCALIGLL